jgi:hypothetical protein
MNGDIYKSDLANRFTGGGGYTTTETTRGDLICFQITNGNAHRAECIERDQAIWNVRVAMVGGTDILPKITTTQRNAATGVQEGQMIWNTTTASQEIYIGAAWV